MTPTTRSGRGAASGISVQIQRAVDRWMAQARREDAPRTPAERLAHVAALREQARRSLRDRDGHARHGTEAWLDGRRAQSRRGRGKSPQSLALIEDARKILAEIHPATVRAVCYVLFMMRLIASMTKGETNRVSAQLTSAREHELIPWGWVVDEKREAERVSAWEDPAAYVETVKRAYRRDRWTAQPAWIEVWSEKGTIRGTLAPVLAAYGITFRVMHGYGSSTALHQAAAESADGDKQLTVLYVGDWDPSGLHMSEVDLPNRLEAYGGNMGLERIALMAEDISGGTLPSESSRRFSIVSTGEAWNRAEVVEAAERESLTSILNAWPGFRAGLEIRGAPAVTSPAA